MAFNLVMNPDGRDFQAQAVLAFVRYLMGGGIEASWDSEFHRYRAEPKVTAYDNCREQGYVVFMKSRHHNKQINVCFYEHRNSDSICVVVNNKETFNAPLLSDFTETMRDKWDTTKNFDCGDAYNAADFIVEQLKAFWDCTVEKCAE